ncbi:hypothetical protein VOLCADRAFT_83165 [Volvox carteri f. nagariensis]|uniref:Uncharacterized protein n=1 Tax=Volvox carteri f. nagariensis TaxID=3068 RepID=D8U9H0_VOLCA|nr:uncharacterized protein VOLCADRAFT_83165 [Volvox carteri f. nagariensis]EFJ43639.1 hypothetical protein VOLCADRAFT_83165 [Volvox carteri f. nagariensis]|eukprot:XP_002955339.1 hypothetical protein VOLCADRAFT_83165 [Volvox carteri f. nagariensis]
MALAARRMSITHQHVFHVARASVPRRLSVCVRAAEEKAPAVVGKAVLVDQIAKEAEITKAQATKAFDSLFNAVQEAVTSGKRVTVLGFGTFESRLRKEKNGRNPRTGETITIPAATAPAFRASVSFKEKVNGKVAPPKAKPAAPKPATPKPAAAPTPRPVTPRTPPAAAAKKVAAPLPAQLPRTKK